MIILRRILREPVFSGQPVLSGHYTEEGSRGYPLDTGLTVFIYNYSSFTGSLRTHNMTSSQLA